MAFSENAYFPTSQTQTPINEVDGELIILDSVEALIKKENTFYNYKYKIQADGSLMLTSPIYVNLRIERHV